MSQNQSSRSTLVIGIGNEYRRDDGVGIVIARRFEERDIPRVKVVKSCGEGAFLLESWVDAEQVIVIDAVQQMGQVGTVHRIDAHEEEVPTGFFNYSSHAFSLAESIELARTLARLPPALVIYGVEGQNFTMGLGLSPEVEDNIEALEALILAEINGVPDA